MKLSKMYGISVVGEGGELETFVLDAPMFKRKIKISKADKVWDGVRGTFEIRSAKLVKKSLTCG
jgi:diphthamide synthase (EF-2-diphthine--ammonia ligase)